MFKELWRRISQLPPFWRIGVPIMGTTIGGVYALMPFQRHRFEAFDRQKGRTLSQKQLEAIYAQKDEAEEVFNLKDEVEKMAKIGTNREWKNTRIVRPGESGTEKS